LALVFLFCETMMNLFNSHPFLAFLIACLLLAGLVVLPPASFAAIPALENFEPGIEQTEFDDNEDLLAWSLVAAALFRLTALKTWLQTLGFRNLRLAPASPPPIFF
jgi:hypothetical protein